MAAASSALLSCSSQLPPRQNEIEAEPAKASPGRDTSERRYFLASLVEFAGSTPCPFKVNAITPACIRLSDPPFARDGKRSFKVVPTREDCDGNITGVHCSGSHLFFDAITLDTIYGDSFKGFASRGAFLIDQIASGKGDWVYRLYDGDGYNTEVTCVYPAANNGIGPGLGQLSDREVSALCERD